MSEFDLDLSYEAARARLQEMDDLLEHPAWKFFVNEIAAPRKRAFEHALQTMSITTQEDVAAYNKAQGRLIELSDLPRILEGIRNDLYEGVKKLQDKLEGQDNE